MRKTWVHALAVCALIAGLITIAALMPQVGSASQGAQPVVVTNTITQPIPTTAPDGTTKVFDATLPNTGLSDTIDVTSYKQIRIVARCFVGGGGMTVSPYVVYGDNASFDVAALGDLTVPCNTGASATYEVPGQTIRVSVTGSGGRIVIYGRTN